MKKFISTKTLLTLIFSAVFFLPSSYGEEEMGERRGRGFFKELNLTKEQKESLNEHRKKNKGSMKGLRQELKTLRAQLDEGFINGDSDSSLKALNEKMASLKERMETNRFEKMIFIKNLLNKEQRQAFIAKKKGFKGKGNRRRRGSSD